MSLPRMFKILTAINLLPARNYIKKFINYDNALGMSCEVLLINDVVEDGLRNSVWAVRG